MASGNERKPSAIAQSVSATRLRFVYSGIDTGHTPGFAIDRPDGWKNHLFLRFRTPMEVQTSTGRGTAEAGDCLIYPPGQPQWYRGRGVPFRDDWMHVDGTLVPELLTRYQVPVGRIFRPASNDFFPVHLSEMLRIKLGKQPFWEEEIELVFHTFVLHLARALTAPTVSPVAAISAKHLLALQEARLSIRQDLQRKWSTTDMACLAGLSPSRFTTWYRAVFGKTPTDDLIQARVERASWLLKTSEQSLDEIAAQCGFNDVYYFIRQFRTRLGITPGRYRAKMQVL